MLFVRACSTVLLTAALVATPAFAGRSHRTPTSGHSKKKTVSHKVQGQRTIDPDRAREIQTALIKQNYLSGEPSGQWDDQTQAAMQKFVQFASDADHHADRSAGSRKEFLRQHEGVLAEYFLAKWPVRAAFAETANGFVQRHDIGVKITPPVFV